MSFKPYIQELADKTANQIKSGYSRKAEGLVITETDLKFTKINLLVNVQKKTANSCQFKTLDMFT